LSLDVRSCLSISNLEMPQAFKEPNSFHKSERSCPKRKAIKSSSLDFQVFSFLVPKMAVLVTVN
ncbi:MAG: hypothetical protein ACK53Q_18305, partial [Dolichospermum sp.]